MATLEGDLKAAQLETAQWLHAQGAALETSNNAGEQPMHFACSNGHLKTAHWLHAQGASLNTADKKGHTPASVAKDASVKEWLAKAMRQQEAAKRREQRAHEAEATDLAGGDEGRLAVSHQCVRLRAGQHMLHLLVQHMQTELKQRTALAERVAQAQRDEQALLKNDAALDYMIEHHRSTDSTAAALTAHDPDATITQYSHPTMGGYLHDPDDSRPELAGLATVADYEVTSAQSAVTKTDMMLEAADRDRELGLTPQLRVPRTRVAGPRLSAQVWCRQCDVPSDEEFRQEWDNEQPLNEPKEPAPTQRTRARATYVQTISEVYLGELHLSLIHI